MDNTLLRKIKRIAEMPVPIAPKNNDPDSSIFDCEMLTSEIRHRSLQFLPHSQHLLADFGIISEPNDFFCDAVNGSIDWRFDDGRKVSARQSPLFTYIEQDHSIEWAWAKPDDLLARWLGAVERVKAWAREHSYFQLLKPYAHIEDQENAYRLAGFCGFLIGAKAIYRARVDEKLSWFLSVDNFQTEGAQ